MDTNTPTAGDFMVRDVRTISADAGLVELIDFLLQHEISSAPVVDDSSGRPIFIGFVSEGDCLEYFSNEILFGSPRITVENVMKKHPMFVSKETDIFTLTTIFIQNGYRHLPVVEGGSLVGLVSRRDILRGLREFHR